MPILKIVEERPLTMVEMKQMLEEVQKRDGDLNHRSKKLKEYLDQFAVMKPTEADKMRERINKLDITRLKDRHISKIIDLNPKDAESLKMILTGETVTLKPEEITKIFEAIKE